MDLGTDSGWSGICMIQPKKHLLLINMLIFGLHIFTNISYYVIGANFNVKW